MAALAVVRSGYWRAACQQSSFIRRHCTEGTVNKLVPGSKGRSVEDAKPTELVSQHILSVDPILFTA